jgi:hypothetical protein
VQHAPLGVLRAAELDVLVLRVAPGALHDFDALVVVCVAIGRLKEPRGRGTRRWGVEAVRAY